MAKINKHDFSWKKLASKITLNVTIIGARSLRVRAGLLLILIGARLAHLDYVEQITNG